MDVNKWIVSLYLHYFGEVNFGSVLLLHHIFIWCCCCCCCARRNCSCNRAWRSALSLHRSSSCLSARSCFALEETQWYRYHIPPWLSGFDFSSFFHFSLWGFSQFFTCLSSYFSPTCFVRLDLLLALTRSVLWLSFLPLFHFHSNIQFGILNVNHHFVSLRFYVLLWTFPKEDWNAPSLSALSLESEWVYFHLAYLQFLATLFYASLFWA